MGYRSNVTLQVNIEGITPQKILSEFERRLKKADEDIVDLFNHIYVDDNCLTIEIVDVKWYDSYTGVQAFMKYVEDLGNELEEESLEGFIHYIRIGENPSDIDERVYGDTSYSTMYIECYTNIGDAVGHEVSLKEYLASSVYDY